jgi:hypothetical protein
MKGGFGLANAMPKDNRWFSEKKLKKLIKWTVNYWSGVLKANLVTWLLTSRCTVVGLLRSWLYCFATTVRSLSKRSFLWAERVEMVRALSLEITLKSRIDVGACAVFCWKTCRFRSLHEAQRISERSTSRAGLCFCCLMAAWINWNGVCARSKVSVVLWNRAKICRRRLRTAGHRKNRCMVVSLETWQIGQEGWQTCHIAPLVQVKNPRWRRRQIKSFVRGCPRPCQSCLQSLCHSSSFQLTPQRALSWSIMDGGVGSIERQQWVGRVQPRSNFPGVSQLVPARGAFQGQCRY